MHGKEEIIPWGFYRNFGRDRWYNRRFLLHIQDGSWLCRGQERTKLQREKKYVMIHSCKAFENVIEELLKTDDDARLSEYRPCVKNKRLPLTTIFNHMRIKSSGPIASRKRFEGLPRQLLICIHLVQREQLCPKIRKLRKTPQDSPACSF